MTAAWIDLGLITYQQAYKLQTSLAEACRVNRHSCNFLILEHEPVFTLGRRGGENHLGVTRSFLAQQGIDLIHIERGGDITYHGPGQIILYPIFNLHHFNLGVADYVSLLEEVMLRTAADYSVTATRDERNHGIWVGDKKMGSIGIAIRHGVTFHGLGLNVNTDLLPFDWIHPCGLTETTMTSIAEQSGTALDMQKIKQRIQYHSATLFDLQFQEQAIHLNP